MIFLPFYIYLGLCATKGCKPTNWQGKFSSVLFVSQVKNGQK